MAEPAGPTLAHRASSLEGVVVADFSRVLAGPMASMILGDLGAQVIKVERPAGDETRGWGPPWSPTGSSTYFEAVNRNKQSIVLDLRQSDDREIATGIVARADVLIENFRPGAMERLGLGLASLRAKHPRLITCSISGFGAGAGAQMPGYDLLIQAVGGLMSVTGAEEGPPHKVGVALVDVIAGLYAAVGVLAALRERAESGLGQQVDVSLLGALLGGLVNQAAGYLRAGVVPGRRGNRHPSIAPYETYGAADGDLAIAVGNDRQFAALCHAIGHPALANDPRFAHNADRVHHAAELRAALAQPIARRTRDQWTRDLTDAGVPAGPVNNIAEAFALADRLGLNAVVEVDGVRQVASPVMLAASPPVYETPPPNLDADRAAVLRWLDNA